jgi:sugar/nucleoside kinase (ribokinase family)
MDATGAGDGFRGAFYNALGRGMGSRRALHLGNVMGGFIACNPGPQEYSIDWEGLLALDRR